MTPARRRAAVAGRFYPAEPDALRALVDRCLAAAVDLPRQPIAAMAPHAGLVYSGACAGALFGGWKPSGTVVILAPNHTGRCASPGASLWRSGAFETPLGDVRVNAALADAIARRCDLVAHDPSAHESEHAIEVELPFLVRRSASAAIVPIVIAWDDWPRSERLAAALAEAVSASAEPVWLLASSDMTHYEPAAVAARKDRIALAALERLDGRGLLDACDRERISMCGRAPAAVVVEAARRLGASTAHVVDYRHSGLISGDRDAVVGYAAVAVS